MLRHYVGNRRKEHIFINERTGKRLTLRQEISSEHVNGTEEVQESFGRHYPAFVEEILEYNFLK